MIMIHVRVVGDHGDVGGPHALQDGRCESGLPAPGSAADADNHRAVLYIICLKGEISVWWLYAMLVTFDIHKVPTV